MHQTINRILILLGCCLFVNFAQEALSQVRSGHNSVRGTAVDAESGVSLPLVNIFLQGTTRGTASGNDGTYVLSDVPDGEYYLVISLVGYERQVLRLALKDSTTKTLNLRLKPRTISFTQVEVTGSVERWKKMFEDFTKGFVGESEFTQLCTFENPGVVRLEFDSVAGYLRASADSVIRLRNDALGYRVLVVIDSFSYNPSTGWITMETFPRYEELKPQNESQLQEWRMNREEAYRQSAPCFFRSLIHGTLKEGNYIVTAGIPRILMEGPGYPITPRSLTIQASPDSSIFEINFLNKALRVDWRPPARPTGDNSFGQTLINILPWNWDFRPTLPKKSRLITVVVPRYEWIACDAYGNLASPLSLVYRGYWATLRFGDLLPFDYEPPRKEPRQ